MMMNKQNKHQIIKVIEIIIFTLSILTFTTMAILLRINKINFIDTNIYNVIANLRCDFLTYIFKLFSFLCSTWFIFSAIVLIIIFIENKRFGFYLGLNVACNALLNQFLKFCFARPRPTQINLIVEKGYSFPSGHSMVSMAFYGFFIYIILKSKLSKKLKIFLSSLFSLLIILIGISRIYLGVHYASDVIAGFTISISYLILTSHFFYKKIYAN